MMSVVGADHLRWRPPTLSGYSQLPSLVRASDNRWRARAMADNNLRRNSSVLVDGPSRAPARAMFKAVGFTDEDLAKPLVGVAHTWIEIMPCTAHLRQLAEHVKKGIRDAGGTPIEFNTIAVCDGISMGTEGMRASLISREVVADSIEL